MSATKYFPSAQLAIAIFSFTVGSVSCGQEHLFQSPPTTLSEALLRLEVIDRGPTRQKQLGPPEFLGEFPVNSAVTLESCRAAAEYSAKMDGRAIVVIVNGQPGYERYEPKWPRWKEHSLGNASECFAGVGAALAVQDGLLEFDEPVSKTITAWASDSRKSKITVRQLLTMTSGLEPGETAYVTTYQEAIQAKSINDPGTTFAHGSHAFQIFGELICRKLSEKNGEVDRMAYVSYLDERIFKPLQIEIGFWRRTVDQEADVALGAFLKGVDFAKFGVLLCNGGHWEGKELIKQELLQEILKGTDANPKYGMGFWLVSQGEDIEVPPETRRIRPMLSRTVIDGMYIAAGVGRQRLYVLPNEKSVIVRLGDPKIEIFRDETFLRNLLVEQDNP